MRAWYVVRVAPGCEATALAVLRERGMAAWFPKEARYRRKTRYQKAKTLREFPAFPGYLFVRCERWALWRVLRGRLFISVLGRRPGEPTALEGEDLARMERWANAPPPDAHAFQRSGREYAGGDTVEVVDGPLIGTVAQVEQVLGERALILLHVIGARRRVEISAAALAKVSAG